MPDWTSLLGSGPNPADIATSTMEAYNGGQRQRLQLDALRQQQANHQRQLGEQAAYRSRVGEMLRVGDLRGAAAQAALIGDGKAATNFVTIQKYGYDQGVAGQGAFGEIARGLANLSYEERRAALPNLKAGLVAMGVRPEQIDAFDPTDQNLAGLTGLGYSAHDRASDTTAAYNGQTQRIVANNPVVVGSSLVTRGGQELFRAPDYITAPMGSNVVEVGGTAANGYTSTTTGPVSAEALYMNAIRPQESGGRPGVIGPQTRYGRAQGSSQMLPATAQSMARKIGVEWRPDLMTAKTPEGLAYQDRLGIAYVQEGLDRSGGDPRAAAAFYHGGPDQSIHGPRTRRYTDEVMARFDRAVGGRQTQGSTRVIQQGQLSPEQQAKANGRPIPQGVGKDYEKDVNQWRALKSSRETFDDNFGGNLAGGIENMAQGIFGSIGTPGQRDWWAGFRATDNVIRNGLFGSALTEHEKAAYTATTISPGMDPKEIRRNLARREQIIQGALQRKQRYLAAQGYSREAIVDLAGADLGGIGTGGPAQPQGQGQAQPAQGGSLRVPRAHVEALKSGRITAAQFDQRYGAGTASRALGN